MTWKVVLGMLLAMLAAFGAQVDSVGGQATAVSLTILVGVRAPNGAQAPTDGGAAQPLAVTPVGGVEVWAMTPGTSSNAPAATAVTDADGAATLALAPGPYWVFVPRADPPGSGPLGA